MNDAHLPFNKLDDGLRYEHQFLFTAWRLHAVVLMCLANQSLLP